MKLGFIVGKDEEIYDDKFLKKTTPNKYLLHGDLNSDVAIAMTIKLYYPHIDVDIILPNEINKTRLQKNNVNFILGYDCINAINDDPYVKKFSNENGLKSLHSIYSNKSCKVFPPIEFLEFIWDKKKYLTKLHKNDVLISPSIFFKNSNSNSNRKINNLLNQVRQYKWDSFIIKPIGGTTAYGFQKFCSSKCSTDLTILYNYFEENDMYKEFIVQELVTGFRKYGEIKMFWINNKYSYAVNTIDRGPDNYKVKMIKDENILDECKKIGEKAINLVPPIIVNKKRVKPVMLRTDFTCCLNNDENKKKYFLNEIEHQDAGSYVNFKSTTYPYVTVMADSFVKKAEELIRLGF